MIRCGCGGSFPDIDGPTHGYMLSTPGCWAAFGEVMAREYSDTARWSVHRLSVDAYAVQHPGEPTPPAIRSVGLHLTSLCAMLEQGLEPRRATILLQRAAERGPEFEWLEPPGDLGSVSVREVRATTSAAEHRRVVREWAEAAWCAWQPYHDRVRGWLESVTDR